MKIGVLALQGAFAEHEKALTALGAEVKEIRQLRDLMTALTALLSQGAKALLWESC